MQHQLNPDEKSHVARFGYDPASRLLEVQFKGKKDEEEKWPYYRYKEVPPSEAQGFYDASSKGTYLNQHIKGTYSCDKIAPRSEE